MYKMKQVKKIAGLIGNTHGNWLFVKYLWVSEELRRHNIGGNILNQAEKNSKRAWLQVFIFRYF